MLISIFFPPVFRRIGALAWGCTMLIDNSSWSARKVRSNWSVVFGTPNFCFIQYVRSLDYLDGGSDTERLAQKGDIMTRKANTSLACNWWYPFRICLLGQFSRILSTVKYKYCKVSFKTSLFKKDRKRIPRAKAYAAP